MKATVKEVKLINWDEPCLVISKYGTLVLATGSHSEDCFEGFDLDSAKCRLSDDWFKNSFVLFEGELNLAKVKSGIIRFRGSKPILCYWK